MELTESQQKNIASTALRFLGRKYETGFKCLDFARLVYREVGIEIPLIDPKKSPPSNLNISPAELRYPPVGHLIFLRDKKRTKPWTHVVIALQGRQCIHCSYFFGKQVVITPLDNLLERYTLAGVRKEEIHPTMK